MFTGLIEEVGKVKNIVRKSSGLRLTIETKEIHRETKVGDSVSVNGACLTVEETNGNELVFFVSGETLKRTNLKLLRVNDWVNLERALRLGDRIGGHLVQGHVDATTKILRIRKTGEEFVFSFQTPKDFHRFMVEKGSVAIDGISLTITNVTQTTFSVTVVPHTFENTNLKFRKVGDTVNVEFDLIGKYLEKLINVPQRGT